MLWTTRQSIVLAAVTLGLAGYLAIRAARHPVDLSPSDGQDDPRIMASLADRLDPNTAPWEALAAIPSLGPHRARAIVAYREQARRDFPGRTPFGRPEDLLRVRGVGAVTVENLRPYLEFGAATPATGP